MPLYALLVVVILSSGAHSEFRCNGLAAFGSDDGEGDLGAWVPGDSRGHVVVETDPAIMVCEARAPGYETWAGSVNFRKDTKYVNITLTRKAQ